MRASLFSAAALAAALGLAACSSGGGSSAIPGSPATSANALHSQLHIVVRGAQPNACHYTACVTTSLASPAQLNLCVTSGSTCPAPGTWSWSQTTYTKRGLVTT